MRFRLFNFPISATLSPHSKIAMPTSHHRIFDQLQQLNCGELRNNAKLISILQAKIGVLDTNQFDQRECAPIARMFAQILKEVLADRYQALSIRAFADLAVALGLLPRPDGRHARRPNREGSLTTFSFSAQPNADSLRRFRRSRRGGHGSRPDSTTLSENQRGADWFHFRDTTA